MKNDIDYRRRALLATFGFATIYGFSFMASRIALQHTNASVLLLIRFTVAMIILLLLVLTGVFKVSLKGKPIGKFLLMGLCQPVIYFVGETLGIQYTNSSFAGVMIATIPVVTAALSAVFMHERISPITIAWIVCSIVGVFIISINQTGSGAVHLKGILFLFLAVVSASVFYMLSKSVASDFTPFERTLIMMLLGFICFFIQAVITEGSALLPELKSGFTDLAVMLPVLYLSVLSSVVAFMLQNYAVSYLDLTSITVFENIIPVISVLAGVLFLHEPFSVVQLIGITLILLGVWKVTTAK